jgi:hypothetical protein
MFACIHVQPKILWECPLLRHIHADKTLIALLRSFKAYAYMHIHMHTYIHTCRQDLNIALEELQRIYIHAYTYAYIHTCRQDLNIALEELQNICIHAYTYMHTYMQTRPQ